MFLDAANDEESSVVSSEPDVEYTEVVHPRPVDPARGRRATHTEKFYRFESISSPIFFLPV